MIGRNHANSYSYWPSVLILFALHKKADLFELFGYVRYRLLDLLFRGILAKFRAELFYYFLVFVFSVAHGPYEDDNLVNLVRLLVLVYEKKVTFL